MSRPLRLQLPGGLHNCKIRPLGCVEPERMNVERLGHILDLHPRQLTQFDGGGFERVAVAMDSSDQSAWPSDTPSVVRSRCLLYRGRYSGPLQPAVGRLLFTPGCSCIRTPARHKRDTPQHRSPARGIHLGGQRNHGISRLATCPSPLRSERAGVRRRTLFSAAPSQASEARTRPPCRLGTPQTPQCQYE